MGGYKIDFEQRSQECLAVCTPFLVPLLGLIFATTFESLGGERTGLVVLLQTTLYKDVAG